MEIGNVTAILSIVASLLSIRMFFLSKKEKDKCVEIRNEVNLKIENQKVEISNKNSAIKSNDSFKIKEVQTFDNRKSIE